MKRLLGQLAATAVLLAFANAGCSNNGVQIDEPDAAPSSDAAPQPTADAAPPAPDTSSPPDASQPQPDAQQPDATHDVAPDAGPSNHSDGCTTGTGLPEGENTFTLDGLDRRYILRLPQNYTTDRAWPLVFALHGNGGNPSYWDGTAAGRNIREVMKDDAILVMAHAIDNQWRDYNLDASAWPARVEQELTYFDKIINDAKAELCIDTSAIFSMGFSGGGSYSGVLGCRRTDIRAIAVGGSVLYFDPADCVGAPAAWIAISEGDYVASREQYLHHFRDTAGCDATSAATTPATCVAYDGCGADTPVHFCNHPGGHVWPEFGDQASWDFFRQFVAQP